MMSFSIMIDTSFDNTEDIFEKQFLERIQKLNGKDQSFRPRSYEDFEGLPCILVVVEKGKMGITYPKTLRWWALSSLIKLHFSSFLIF